MNKCYVDGKPCSCNAMDVMSDCPRDPYAHDADEDFMGEDEIDEAYQSLRRYHDEHDEEIFR